MTTRTVAARMRMSCREGEGLVVGGVEPGPLGEGRGVAVRDLPYAGDAGAQVVIVRPRIHGLLVHHHRARADDAHVALEAHCRAAAPRRARSCAELARGG